MDPITLLERLVELADEIPSNYGDALRFVDPAYAEAGRWAASIFSEKRKNDDGLWGVVLHEDSHKKHAPRLYAVIAYFKPWLPPWKRAPGASSPSKPKKRAAPEPTALPAKRARNKVAYYESDQENEEEAYVADDDDDDSEEDEGTAKRAMAEVVDLCASSDDEAAPVARQQPASIEISSDDDEAAPAPATRPADDGGDDSEEDDDSDA